MSDGARPAANDGRAPDAEPPVRVGERFSLAVSFDAASVSAFATMCGDSNPLHHDAEYAARSRLGTLIACGPHVISRMMGMNATDFSHRFEALGLEYTFRFVRAVPVGITLDLHWTITAVEWKGSLAGHIVSLAGEAVDDEGAVYVSGRGAILIRPKA